MHGVTFDLLDYTVMITIKIMIPVTRSSNENYSADRSRRIFVLTLLCIHLFVFNSYIVVYRRILVSAAIIDMKVSRTSEILVIGSI